MYYIAGDMLQTFIFLQLSAYIRDICNKYFLVINSVHIIYHWWSTSLQSEYITSL